MQKNSEESVKRKAVFDNGENASGSGGIKKKPKILVRQTDGPGTPKNQRTNVGQTDRPYSDGER